MGLMLDKALNFKMIFRLIRNLIKVRNNLTMVWTFFLSETPVSFYWIIFIYTWAVCPKTIHQFKTSFSEEREKEIVSQPEKELHFLTRWMVIMTVLLNRLMRRTVLSEPRVPSLWGLNAFCILEGQRSWQPAQWGNNDLCINKSIKTINITGLPCS